LSESCLAVIPARGGSKRIPGKNVRLMNDKPLIAYTIEAALASRVFERVVVSTDSPGIAAIATRWGAEVPFLRDAGLADDHTPVSAATLDLVERLDPEGRAYRFVAQLMANCPLRTAEDVIASHHAFLAGGVEAQISVTRYGWQTPWWALRRDGDGRLEPIFDGLLTRRSQDLPELFCPTGAIWWAKASALRREGTYHMANRTGWVLDWRHAIDIDVEEDWELATLLMEQSERRERDAV
jgi:CMP-N-acetylneuraminic acid synthetase